MKRKADKDYYKILGVDKNADPDTIKKAYRKKALEHHPDRNKGDKKSEELFKDISEAYEVLSDNDKKSRYDRGDEFEFCFDPNDIFAQMFNMAFNFGGNSRTKKKRSYGVRFRPDNKLVYRAGIEDIIKGKKIEIDFTRHITCEKCQGVGYIEKEEICDVCNGQGMLNSLNGNVYFSMTCGECGGSGKKMSKCKDCEGNGYKSVSEKASVNLPPGIGPMSALKMTGKGNTIYFNGQKTTGDTYIVIDYPQREKGVILSNGDIHTSITVPFNTVMSEKEIKVNILGCKEITLKLDSSKKTGHQYKIEHQGVTDKNNAFIRVFIDIPKMSAENKQKILAVVNDVLEKTSMVYSPDPQLSYT